MTTTKNLPEAEIHFLLNLASGNDQNNDADFNRLDSIREALDDTDLPAGVTVTEPEGQAWLLSSRDVEGNERPIRIFLNEWEIDLIVSIGADVDQYGIGPRMIKTPLPTGLKIDVA